MGGRNWKDLSNSSIDPTMVYRHRLPSGKTINLFFYDGPISRAIAFEGVLDNGQQFAERLLGAFSEDTRPWPELVHIATDGETYGHHHKYGEMALAYALDYIESKGLAELINYGLYLERHPADSRGGDLREQLLELRARRRTLAQQLRLQLRRASGLEPGVARPLARGSGLASRHAGPLFRRESQAVAEGSVGGAQRLH